jgi:hypothetical protein
MASNVDLFSQGCGIQPWNMEQIAGWGNMTKRTSSPKQVQHSELLPQLDWHLQHQFVQHWRWLRELTIVVDRCKNILKILRWSFPNFFPKAKNCGPTLQVHAAVCCVIQIGNQSSDGRQIQELETSRKSENHKPKTAVLESTSITIPSSCSHLLITVHSLQLDTPLMQANVQCIFVLFEFLPDFCSPSKQCTPSVPCTPRILYFVHTRYIDTEILSFIISPSCSACLYKFNALWKKSPMGLLSCELFMDLGVNCSILAGHFTG